MTAREVAAAWHDHADALTRCADREDRRARRSRSARAAMVRAMRADDMRNEARQAMTVAAQIGGAQ